MTKTDRFLPRPVAVWLPEGGQLIGVVGLVEAFDAASRFRQHRGRPAPYAVRVVGGQESTRSSAGLRIHTPAADALEPVHTVVIGGGLPGTQAPVSASELSVLDRLCARAERIVSICAGAFVLADLGLLQGRRCTTHWMLTEALAARVPTATVMPDALFTADGRIFTSAGATAGIDLALHLIRLDEGRRLARAVARALVVFAQRPGGQSQFSAAIEAQQARSERIRTVMSQVVEAPAGDHSVPDLARSAGMSERQFARAFKAQVGETPAAWVRRVRLQAAQRLLLDGEDSLAGVAACSGLGSEASLRRVFQRELGVSPAAWRRRSQ